MHLRLGWRTIIISVGWRFVAAWLAALTLIWATYALAHRTVVDSMERDLQQRLETDTFVLEDHASRALDGVVSRLEAVAALSASQELANKPKFSQQLRDLLYDDTLVRSLSLVDTQGYIVVSSNLSSLGTRATPEVLASIGPAPLQPRNGVRFGSSLAQRDLTEPPIQSMKDGGSQAIWLAQIDAKTSDLSGHRWIVAINSGFFQNFWATATRRSDFTVGLFSYNGQRLVSLGKGPAASERLSKGLEASLQVRDNGVVALQDFDGWLIRYRASRRHPLAFVMFVDRAAQVQEQLDRTSVLRWSAIGSSLLASSVIGLFYLNSRRHRRFAWANTQLRKQANTDVLTGLANRRAFDEMLPQELARARALGSPLSLLVMDLDQFKAINDQFGHSAGDAVLRKLALRWQRLLRTHDFIARIGGDEFCVILSSTGSEQAELVVRKLIDVTRREPVLIPGVETALDVTVSVGVVGSDICPADADWATLLAMADKALYRAKEEGRDQYIVAARP